MFSEDAIKIILGIVAALVILAIIVFGANRGKKSLTERAKGADENAKIVESETKKLMQP